MPARAQDPDELIEDGWREQEANPNDPTSTDENTYAYVRRYADGRVIFQYFRRGRDAPPVEVRNIDRKQKKDFDDSQPAPRTPSGEAQDANATELERQRRANAALPPDQDPRYETDKERADRARQQIIDQGAQAEREQTNREQAEARREAAEARRIAAENQTRTEARLDRSEDRAARAEDRALAAANRPQIISAPSGQRRIAQMDAEGNITSVDNPNFDEAAYERQAAKERAQAERDRLSLQIEAGKLTEASAAAQYKRWFDENVTIPIQRAQEARARAAELRAAQEAEDRRQQFAATYEKDRQTTAISAGNQAANAFNSNLQYQVGPKFGEQFAQALNSFQPGAPPANFTADAFTFKGPSIEAVARKATAKALAGISPYAQAIATAGERPLQVASYGGGTEMGGGAPPPAAAPVDYAGMINQYLQNNPYVPGSGGGDEEDQ